MASVTVQKKLMELKDAVSVDNSIKYVQRIDNVLFSHGGVSDFFARECVTSYMYNDVDSVVDAINCLGKYQMWNDDSPIWLRPQYSNKGREVYGGTSLGQV